MKWRTWVPLAVALALHALLIKKATLLGTPLI